MALEGASASDDGLPFGALLPLLSLACPQTVVVGKSKALQHHTALNMSKPFRILPVCQATLPISLDRLYTHQAITVAFVSQHCSIDICISAVTSEPLNFPIDKDTHARIAASKHNLTADGTHSRQ